MKKRILISAGESSGDIHAAKLIKELRLIYPDVEFFGIGCDKMESAGVNLIQRMDKHAIVGVWEVVASLNFIRNLFKSFSMEIDSKKVDLAILIDYPGFNLQLAKMLKKRNIPSIYYILPQVWAWGSWRINAIKKIISKAIVILGFEEALYKKSGVDATFVGHPILDEPYKPLAKTTRTSLPGISQDKFTIALLPGSRPLEVKKLLPVMVKAAHLIKEKKDVQFIISKSPNVDKKIYDDGRGNFEAVMIESDVHKCISASDFVLTASGTVTLQVALEEKPMVITYITSFFTYLLYKIFVKIPYVGLVNIIAGKFIVPELLQLEARPEKLASAILDIISSENKVSKMRNDLRQVKESLGEPGASKRAAEIISGFIQRL